MKGPLHVEIDYASDLPLEEDTGARATTKDKLQKVPNGP
jgi:hypothetical protein